MNDAGVELREVVKRHGSTVAVANLSLSVKSGEFFSILGPSGSGKTTTLRLIAGFEQPDQGDILIAGRSMREVPPNLRPANLVFQHYALFPHLTVFGNIAFGLEMSGVARTDMRARVADAVRMVKLDGKEDRYPSHLSGGEQQRVALARALVNRPAVVLLDEPLGALDQQLRQEMQIELKTIQEQVGLTFICVTHHQEEALTMSDRVAVMDHGRLLQIGTPRDVYDHPASLFVAGFIGLSNRLDGTVDSIEGTKGLLHVPSLPPIRTTVPAGMGSGRGMSLVVRPERVHLSRDGAPNGYDNAVPARVEKAVYNGHEMQYQLQLAGAIHWTARLPNDGNAQGRFAPGEAVVVRWNISEAAALIE